MAAPNPDASDKQAPAAEGTPAPTAKPPVFASNDDALAAATAAYAAYTTASDNFLTTVSARGDLAVFSSSVSSEYLPEVLAGLNSFAQSGQLGHGTSAFDTVSVVSYSDTSPGYAEVDLYLCADFSDIRVLDGAGTDVTPTTRPGRVPLQVGFVSSESDPTKLLIDREDSWSGQNFCL